LLESEGKLEDKNFLLHLKGKIPLQFRIQKSNQKSWKNPKNIFSFRGKNKEKNFKTFVNIIPLV